MAEKTTAFTGPVVVGLNDKKGEIRLTDGKNPNEAKYLSIAAPDTLTSNTTLTFPNSVGTNGQFLKTDGNGDLTWSTPNTGGIAAVVDDTSPELGGDLASNGHDINFADNDKAKFGNSGDLEIFHDGTNSLIKDVGTGQLKISGFDAVKITNGDDTIPSAQFISSGEAQLYYAGNQKLAANTDGITVTGKVVSDGLEVDGDIKLDGNYPTGTNNVALGNTALDSITSGNENTAIGANALTALTTQSGSTAVGFNAASSTTGGNNTAIGESALADNVTGVNNTFVGKSAGRFATSNNNVGIGHEALGSGGFDNVAVGQSAGSTITSGNNLTVLGHNAEPSSPTATNEVTLGDANVTSLRIPGLQSGASTNDVLTFDGSKIVLAAAAAADPITSSLNIGSTKTIKLDAVFPDGTRNSFLGENAGANITTGDSNVGVGFGALEANQSGNENIAIGRAALSSSTNSNDNIAIGGNAAASTSGGNNVCIGKGAASNMSGFSSENVIIGRAAANGGGTGVRSVVIGDVACLSNIPSDAVAIGANTMSSTSGQYNTAVGQSAGSNIGTGTNSTCIGYNADPSTSGVSNEITLGNASVSTLRCQVTSITSLSDARDKKDVEDANIGLDFINDLRPVKFVWDTRDGAKKDIKEVGFIAQELDEVQQKHGVEDHLQLVLKNNPDKLEASQGKLIPILVQAIKDLKKEIDELKKA
jgi:hypothetical protein